MFRQSVANAAERADSKIVWETTSVIQTLTAVANSESEAD